MGDSKILVAKILNTKGLNGEVKLKSYTENILSVKNYPLVDENEVSYKIDKAYLYKELVIAKIQGINTKEDAQSILGKSLYIYKGNLPVIDKNSYYVVDLLGSSILDTNNNIIGKLINIYNFGAGDILEVNIKDKIFMLPFGKDVILDINIKEGIIILSDMYKEYM